MSGCHSCPIRCMTQMNIPRVKEFGVPSTGGNTCVANFVHTTIFPNGPKDFEDKDDGRVIGNPVGLNLFDDYGLWCNYGQLHRDFIYCYSKGVFKRVLPAEEYAEIRWDQLEAGDVNFIKDFYYRLAHRVGELSHRLMVHMPSQNAGIWVKSTGATRKINSGRRLAIQFTTPMKRQRRSAPLLTVCSTVTA